MVLVDACDTWYTKYIFGLIHRHRDKYMVNRVFVASDMIVKDAAKTHNNKNKFPLKRKVSSGSMISYFG